MMTRLGTAAKMPFKRHLERLIGSIRRECIDHLIVLNEDHLRRILAKFSTYYNGSRSLMFRSGCPEPAPDRALRKYRCTCNPGRTTSSVRTNLVFGSDRSFFQPKCIVSPTDRNEKRRTLRFGRSSAHSSRFAVAEPCPQALLQVATRRRRG
jgi:hypothetical protein